MISYLHPSGIECTVEPIRWTPGGRVQCRRVGLVLTAFYSVEVFSLTHPRGRKALAAMLARLPS